MEEQINESDIMPPQCDPVDTDADIELLKAIAANPDTARLLARMAKGEDISADLNPAPQKPEKDNEPLYRGPENAPYAGPRSYDGFLATSRPGFWD